MSLAPAELGFFFASRPCWEFCNINEKVSRAVDTICLLSLMTSHGFSWEAWHVWIDIFAWIVGLESSESSCSVCYVLFTWSLFVLIAFFIMISHIHSYHFTKEQMRIPFSVWLAWSKEDWIFCSLHALIASRGMPDWKTSTSTTEKDCTYHHWSSPCPPGPGAWLLAIRYLSAGAPGASIACMLS